MRTWQNFFDKKIKELAEHGTIYDIGGGASPLERERFKKYVLVDIDSSYNPDIVADIQDLPFSDNSIDAILCLAVLEHVQNPFKAAEELYRVLKPQGKILLSVPFMWPYHANEHYKDYWRFSEDGLEFLFRDFSKTEIIKGGGYFSVWVNLIPAYLVLHRFLKPIAAYVDDKWKIGRKNFPTYFIFLVK